MFAAIPRVPFNRFTRRRVNRVAALLVPWLCAASVAAADSAFLQIERPPFTYLYTDSRELKIDELDARLQKRLPEISRGLGVGAPGAITVLLLSPNREEAFFGEQADVPTWLQGLAIPERSLVVVRLRRTGNYPYKDIGSVAEHELVHLLVFAGAAPHAHRLPRWFHEGTAMLLAREWRFGDRWNLFSAAMGARLLPMSAIDRSFPRDTHGAHAAYAEAFSFVRYLVREHGHPLLSGLLKGVREGATLEAAYQSLTGTTLAAAERRWRRNVHIIYRWIAVGSSSLVLWGGMSVLLVVGYIRKRRLTRATLKRWEEEEGPDHSWDSDEAIH